MENLEVQAVMTSPAFEFVISTTNGINPIHRFQVRGSHLVVALHENPVTGRLYAMWIDGGKANARTGRFPGVQSVMEVLPPAAREEVIRLRPILSRRYGADGDVDALDDKGKPPQAPP